MTRPTIQINASALSDLDACWKAPRLILLHWKPNDGEMAVRLRLGRLIDFYDAGTKVDGSHPMFVAGCRKVLKELTPYKAQWEAVTGRCWLLFMPVKRQPAGPESGPMRQAIGSSAIEPSMPKFPTLWKMPEVARAERGRQQVLDAAERSARSRRVLGAEPKRNEWAEWERAAHHAHRRANAGQERERAR